jgi:hypothetical protein
MWWKRYEHILERKPVTTREALVDVLAKEQVELLESFPPDEAQIEWTDERLAAKLRGRVHELPRPDADFVALLAEIVRLDLLHETDRIDWLFRNEQHRAACPTQAHVDALHLLWRVCLELLYARKEELAQHGLKTKDLLAIIEKVPPIFAARRAQLN